MHSIIPGFRPLKPRPLPLHRYLDSSPALAQLARQAIQAQQLLERVRTCLSADLALHLSAARARGNILVLYADSPAWASRIRYITPRIRAELAEYREIRIRIDPMETPVSKPVGNQARRVLKNETAAMINAVASMVADPELCQALKLLASHHDGLT